MIPGPVLEQIFSGLMMVISFLNSMDYVACMDINLSGGREVKHVATYRCSCPIGIC